MTDGGPVDHEDAAAQARALRQADERSPPFLVNRIVRHFGAATAACRTIAETA